MSRLCVLGSLSDHSAHKGRCSHASPLVCISLVLHLHTSAHALPRHLLTHTVRYDSCIGLLTVR
ncbi:hypothetical protein BJV78DRAFT_1272018 [Lactifluus subvellereus]|nr:hypothetical protein BJV78DRAFT_1272018 [Lactifluus subvellereus]